jgi:hypothetical protein
LEVEGVGGDGGPSRLDLALEVLGLVDEELLTVGHVAEDVLLEADDALLAFVVVINYERAGQVLRGAVGAEAGPIVAALDSAADRGE